MATTLGQFFKQPPNHVPASTIQPAPDTTFKDPHPPPPHPGGQAVPALSVPMGPQKIEPAPALRVPSTVPFEKAPALSSPGKVDFQPPPTLRSPSKVDFEPPPALRTPNTIPFEPSPALRVPDTIAFEPPPALRVPNSIPFEPPPALRVPSEVTSEPPPTLSTPATMEFQAPPALSLPTAPPFEQAPTLRQPNPVAGTVKVFLPPNVLPKPMPGDQPVPKLSQPMPVNDVGGPAWVDMPGYLGIWDAAVARQVAFFTQQVPIILRNMLSRALPYPGNIDPDLLPSTIATKLLRAGSVMIAQAENKYFYEPMGNAGMKLNTAIFGGLLNSAPEGSYENSPFAPSLRNINEAGAKDPGLTLKELYWPDRVTLIGNYTDYIKDDRLFKLMPNSKGGDGVVRYRFDFDDDNEFYLDLEKNDLINAAAGTYLPFYMTDMRSDRDGKFRTVFFQPTNLTIKESFAPMWNMQNFFGRVDPVATYQSTTRTINVSFMMIAEHPSDMAAIYGKLKWLTAMVYPEYTPSVQYNSGPVIKLRIGNLINASSRLIPLSEQQPGVAGIITALDFDYSDSTWELQADSQLPRKVMVNFAFTALHELPVGVLEGSFGTVGTLDSNGVYMTPKQSVDSGNATSANFDSPATTEDELVDANGFRNTGLEWKQQPPPFVNTQEDMNPYEF